MPGYWRADGTYSDGSSDVQLTGSNGNKASVNSDGSMVMNLNGNLKSNFNSDSISQLNAGYYLGGLPSLYNDATNNWERQRNNTQGTALASAARTAYTASPNQTNYNARGIIVFLNISTASGTGGLTVRVRGIDPITGSGVALATAPSPKTDTGLIAIELFPGASGSTGGGNGTIVGRGSGSLPRTWQIDVLHGDATSYTYSVGYQLIV